MSNDLYSQLGWLPAAPDEFSMECRQLPRSPADLGKRVQHLASHALDENQLNRLAKAIQKARDAGYSLQPLSPFRIGLLSNATSHFIVPALVASAARHGIALECIEAEYDQIMQTALSPDSLVNQAQCDAVLMAIDHRGLALNPTPGDAWSAQQTVEAALAYMNTDSQRTAQPQQGDLHPADASAAGRVAIRQFGFGAAGDNAPAGR